MLTQKEIAEKWGISRARVCTMVKNGMPITSMAEAENWKLINQKRPGRGKAVLSQSISSSETSATLDAESQRSETSLGRLIRGKKAELVAYSLVVQSAKERNPVAMRAAIQGWGEAKKRIAEAEMEHARFEEVTRVLVRMDEVRETFTKYLGGIRALLDAMPSSLASRANPSDPECSKQAMEEGVNQIYLAIQKAELEAFK